MYDGLIVQFFVVDLAMVGDRFALLSAVSLAVFGSVLLSTVIFDPVTGMHPESVAGYCQQVRGIVHLVVIIPVNKVLRFVGNINLSDDTINVIIFRLFFLFRN